MASYTDMQKSEALWLVDNGWPAVDVERIVGCSSASLYAWRKQRDNGDLVLPKFEPSANLRLALRRRQAEAMGGSLPGDGGTAEQQTLDTPEPDVESTPEPDVESRPTPSVAELQTLAIEPPPSTLPVRVPVLTNGDAVERAAVVELGVPVEYVVAELRALREQIAEAQQRAAESDAALARAHASAEQMREQIAVLEQRQDEAQDVAAEALTGERDKARAFRQTIRYLITEDD